MIVVYPLCGVLCVYCVYWVACLILGLITYWRTTPAERASLQQGLGEQFRALRPRLWHGRR